MGIRESKNIQRICEQSEELRELEEKLKSAYMNKERAAQIQERSQLQTQKMRNEAHIDAQMEMDRQRGMMAEAYREQLRRQDAIDVRHTQVEQIEDQESRRAAAYADFLKEKAMVDEVVRRIMEEDAAEMSARIAKQEETRQYIDKFMVDREEWKQQQQRQVEEENRKIQEYAAKVQQRQAE